MITKCRQSTSTEYVGIFTFKFILQENRTALLQILTGSIGTDTNNEKLKIKWRTTASRIYIRYIYVCVYIGTKYVLHEGIIL